MLSPLRLALISTGRQGAFSLWTALNSHPQLFLPDFATSDRLLLEGGDYDSSGPYGYQHHAPRQIPGLELACLVHGFSALDRMPGPVPERLAKALTGDAVMVLVTRDPAENLVSMYHTQLELFFGRKHFGLIPAGHRLYDRDEPMPFDEYIEFAAYGVDYGRQLDDFGPLFSEQLLFDFEDILADRLAQSLTQMVESIGLDPLERWSESPLPNNAGGKLIHQRLFGMRSKLELDGFGFDLGFFGSESDPLMRGSLEWKLETDPLPGGVAAFTSGQTWFRVPLAYRQYLLEGAGRELIAERYAEFQAYLDGIARNSAPYRIKQWGESALEAFETHIAPNARRFRDRAPEASRSWSQDVASVA
ncbi:MAG: hypothetical protein ACI841_002075 [Planctomycetota bacterium]